MNPSSFPPPAPTKPTRPYVSFLVCIHPDKTDVYFNGLPIGKVESGVFVPQVYSMGKEERVIRLTDLNHPCPFNTVAEVKTALIDIVDKIVLDETVEKPKVSS